MRTFLVLFFTVMHIEMGFFALAQEHETNSLSQRILRYKDQLYRPHVILADKHIAVFDISSDTTTLYRMPRDAYLAGEQTWKASSSLSYRKIGMNKHDTLTGISCGAIDFKRCLLTFSQAGGDRNKIIEVDFTKGRASNRGFHLPIAYNSAEYIGAYGRKILFSHDTVRQVNRVPFDYYLWQEGLDYSSAPMVLKAPKKSQASAIQRLNGKAGALVQFEYEDGMVESYYLGENGRATSLTRREIVASPYSMLIAACSPQFVLRDRLFCHQLDEVLFEDMRIPTASLISLPVESIFKHSVQNADILVHFQVAHGQVFEAVHRLASQVLVVTYERASARNRLYLISSKNRVTEVALPIQGSVEVKGVDGTKDHAILTLESYLSPPTDYYVSFDAGTEKSVFKALPEQTSFSINSDLIVHHETITGDHGFPLSYEIIGNKADIKKGNVPVIVSAYAYGGVLTKPVFVPHLLEGWFPNGGIFVVAHPRGDGVYESSDPARDDKTASRQQTIDDFIAITEHLVATGRADPKRIHGEGMSAGASLVVSAALKRPALYTSVTAIAGCYFPDMAEDACGNYFAAAQEAPVANTDPQTAASTGAKATAFAPSTMAKRMMAKNTHRPHILLVANRNDDRVNFDHSLRFAAVLKQSGFPVSTLFEDIGGHFLGITNEDIARKQAAILILQQTLSAP